MASLSRRGPPRHALTRLAESDQPSTRLRVLAGLFTVAGVTGAVGVTGATLALVTGRLVLPATRPNHPAWSLLLGAITALTWWWAGRMLAHRQRAGAYVALTAFALPLLMVALGAGAATGLGGLAVNAVGCVLLASVWRELD